MRNEVVTHCTVCGRGVAERLSYGGRTYCRQHLNLFTEDVQAVWQASVFVVGALIAIIVGLAVAGGLFDVEVFGVSRLVTGVAVSVLPPVFWLFSFTRLSLRSGTAPPLLTIIFVLAALLAAAISRPLLYDIIQIDGWLATATAPDRLIASILLGGSIHAFVLYAVIRYTVWLTPTFERRIDGVVYGLVTAWGYAAVFNTLFVFDHGGLALVNGTFRLVAQTFAFLVTGLIVGYFLGRNRFEDMPFYYMPAGIALAAVANGFLFFAGVELNNIRVNLTSDGFTPWPGLLLNLAALILTLAAIYGLLRRHNALTRARLESKAA